MKVSKTARFYYKGNKRKVNSQAWLKAKAFENAPDLCSKDNKEYEFHLFGKKYKNKEEFKKLRKFAHLQNQVDNF